MSAPVRERGALDCRVEVDGEQAILRLQARTPGALPARMRIPGTFRVLSTEGVAEEGGGIHALMQGADEVRFVLAPPA